MKFLSMRTNFVRLICLLVLVSTLTLKVYSAESDQTAIEETPIITSPLIVTSAVVKTDEVVKEDFLNHLEPLENPELFLAPEQTQEPVLKAIESAEKTLHIGIYGISSKMYVTSLLKAQARGVDITIICDRYCSNSLYKQGLMDQLKQAGIKVITATDGFSITHWKMFVIDQKKVFISSLNWIGRIELMRETGLFITNPSIIQEILEVFKMDLTNAEQKTNFTPPLSQPNLVWSPTEAEPKLLKLIQAAHKTIDLWTENMGAKKIHQALKEAVLKQVNVRVLTSRCSLGNLQQAFDNLNDLRTGGIEVRVMPSPNTTATPFIHAKTILVDDQYTFLGSQNFSLNAIKKARELGLIFKDSAVQSRLQETFNKDWQQALPLDLAVPTDCPVAAGGG